MIAFRAPSRVAIGFLCSLLSGCGSLRNSAPPSIDFTAIPEADWGGSGIVETIQGHAKGFKTGQRIVLFAKSGSWWLQPSDSAPFTAIQPDSTWKSSVHLGTEYAALLVEPGYSPPAAPTTDVLPAKGGGVVAVATVPAPPGPLAPKKIRFSGYEWQVRQLPSDGGGVAHANLASNAWTDAKGWLHLRMTHEGGEWAGAELNLSRSLGYGSYSFVVRQAPRFEPGTVLGLFTYDHLESGADHREIDIELSQWGDPAIKNAQFVIQPYFVPANVFRFMSPAGAALTHSFRWEAGRVSFQTVQAGPDAQSRVLAEHVFTSGIPSPGEEKVHLNLYVYGRSRTPQQNGVEVIIEKFEYLP
ncbi:MAG: hypothetical protein ABSG03_01130 [Bryobacteraceae bacterium]|jgi:hypothetical protein